MEVGRVCVKGLGVAAAVALLCLQTADAAVPSRWAIQPTFSPSSTSFFSGVSCSSRNACTAVGRYTSGLCRCQPAPLVERWDGTHWSIQRTAALGINGGRFTAVSCPSRTVCTAVGGGLAERWDGTRWSIQPLPRDTGALLSVSCPSIRMCTAVGYGGLADRWDGTSWSLQRAAPPRRPKNVSLQAVSCPSSRACTAVGSYTRGGRQWLLIERWNGRTWSIQRPAYPASATRRSYPSLSGVSCPSINACTAVGFSNRGGIVERWNGTRWAIQRPARPLGGLSAVSCPSTNVCTAIGGGGSWAERWDGTRWTVQSVPALRLPGGFSGVSCPSTNACTAVGSLGPDLQISYYGVTTLAAHWSTRRSSS